MSDNSSNFTFAFMKDASYATPLGVEELAELNLCILKHKFQNVSHESASKHLFH